MFQYRQALVRLRAGDTVRRIARAGLMGRDKLYAFKALAERHGWLDAAAALPGDEAIAAVLAPARRARSTVSSAEPLREVVQRWFDAGVQGRAIHAALKREHGFAGSYSAVVRMLRRLRAGAPPQVTVRLTFAPAEAAQVDFGAGPLLVHPDGRARRTWAFVMTLCHSRHQYVEFVWDQTVATWLGCHRRAFEWFGGVVERVIVDNAKCAIVKACRHDPLVQCAYAECAEGYGFRVEACPPADPQKKGVVEAGVKYLKANFMPTRSFRDLADLNAQARAWVLEEAGVREHGASRWCSSRWSVRCSSPCRRSRRIWAAGTGWCCTGTATCSSSGRCTRRRGRWWGARCGCARPTRWWRCTRTGATSTRTCARSARASGARSPSTCRPRRGRSLRATGAGALSRRRASGRTAPSSSTGCSATASPSGCAPRRA